MIPAKRRTIPVLTEFFERFKARDPSHRDKNCGYNLAKLIFVNLRECWLPYFSNHDYWLYDILLTIYSIDTFQAPWFPARGAIKRECTCTTSTGGGSASSLGLEDWRKYDRIAARFGRPAAASRSSGILSTQWRPGRYPTGAARRSPRMAATRSPPPAPHSNTSPLPSPPPQAGEGQGGGRVGERQRRRSPPRSARPLSGERRASHPRQAPPGELNARRDKHPQCTWRRQTLAQ
jgi:hypothetical protein